METGVPLHVHGSNLVVDEELENRIGWDIGTLDGVPFVAEDYMFGMDAFLKEGREVFGWHGAVAWEQPPFSFPSVYRQRYRWVFGVLQGMSVDTALPEFHRLPRLLQFKVTWGTRYRIATYALGTAVGALSLLYLPLALTAIILQEKAGSAASPSPWLDAWFSLVGFMWLGANLLGAWMNALHTGRRSLAIVTEAARAIVISPVGGIMENMAAMSAVVKWVSGTRDMVWHTTPSTKAADDALRGRAEVAQRSLAEAVTEAQLPQASRSHWLPLILLAPVAIALIAGYIGTPLLLTAQGVIGGSGVVAPAVIASALLATTMTAICLRVKRLTSPQSTGSGRHRLGASWQPVAAVRAAQLEPVPAPVPETVTFQAVK
jgi:hypothetical protein